MLGQLFLLACVAATLSIAAIFFVLYGPVPVKKRVMVVPRLPTFAATPAPTLVAQLAPASAPQFTPAQPLAPPFTPAPPPVSSRAPSPMPLPAAATPESLPVIAAPARKPKGAKVQPLPRKRVARGTDNPAPFAPVVRHRPREEDVATAPVSTFDAEELTTIDERY
ncbi:MAG TPA: hypothetical protein VFS15_13355 [Kofleriaceae bacterium]|nr:hypothetical protein [Kofleriaceae bacterium]